MGQNHSIRRVPTPPLDRAEWDFRAEVVLSEFVERCYVYEWLRELCIRSSKAKRLVKHWRLQDEGGPKDGNGEIEPGAKNLGAKVNKSELSAQAQMLAQLQSKAPIRERSPNPEDIEPKSEMPRELKSWVSHWYLQPIALHHSFFPHKPFTRLNLGELGMLMDYWMPGFPELHRRGGATPLWQVPTTLHGSTSRTDSKQVLEFWEKAQRDLEDPERQKRRQERDSEKRSLFQGLFFPDPAPLVTGTFVINWWFSDKEIAEKLLG